MVEYQKINIELLTWKLDVWQRIYLEMLIKYVTCCVIWYIAKRIIMFLKILSGLWREIDTFWVNVEENLIFCWNLDVSYNFRLEKYPWVPEISRIFGILSWIFYHFSISNYFLKKIQVLKNTLDNFRYSRVPQIIKSIFEYLKIFKKFLEIKNSL